jgi:hypothetical protein
MSGPDWLVVAWRRQFDGGVRDGRGEAAHLTVSLTRGQCSRDRDRDMPIEINRLATGRHRRRAVNVRPAGWRRVN